MISAFGVEHGEISKATYDPVDISKGLPSAARTSRTVNRYNYFKFRGRNTSVRVPAHPDNFKSGGVLDQKVKNWQEGKLRSQRLSEEREKRQNFQLPRLRRKRNSEVSRARTHDPSWKPESGGVLEPLGIYQPKNAHEFIMMQRGYTPPVREFPYYAHNRGQKRKSGIKRGPYKKRSTGEIEKSWQTKDGKNPKGGLNEKGRKSYERENPGSNLKAPVKAGNNPRRASFLARMGNMPGPERKPNGEPTRLLLSLQAWGASSKADAKRKAAAISNRNVSKSSQTAAVKWARRAKEMERLKAPKSLVERMRTGDTSGPIKSSDWLRGARDGRSALQAQKPLNPERLDNRVLPKTVIVDGAARRVSHADGSHVYIYTPNGVHGIPRNRVIFPKRPKQP